MGIKVYFVVALTEKEDISKLESFNSYFTPLPNTAPHGIFFSLIIYIDLLLPVASASIRAALNYIT